jgi:molybdopterin-guanine dinucleotide biosynthesis protein A
VRVVGLILAGGRGRRLGGVDKAFVALDGRPLIAHAIARLEGKVLALAISANGDPARFSGFDLPILPDAQQHEDKGPLAGIVAGLAWAMSKGAQSLLCVPVDTPYLPSDLLARLSAAQTLPAYAVTAQRAHPTIALWPVSDLERLNRALAAGERRLRVVLAEASQVTFPDESAFFNINTPDNLARAKQQVAS